MPKGVDLNLDKFSLEEAEAAVEQPAVGWVGKDFTGANFWSNMSSAALAEEDRALLQDVFKASLSDRREDGELFVPPATSFDYISALRGLINEEARVMTQRRELFVSEDFDMDAAGPLFPSSWTPKVAVAHGQKQAALHSRPDYKFQAARLLKTATPSFDNVTEDGARFRIYRAGCMEARTIQQHNGEEEVAAVFSSNASTKNSATGELVAGSDKIVKVTMYVEKPQQEASAARHFYLVLETDLGDLIATEQLADKTLTWAENPAELEYRNSQAKVLRSADCSSIKLTVQAVRRYQSESSSGSAKHYANALFLWAAPARLKTFAALAEHELQGARELGVCSPAAWDQGSSQVWGLSWERLGDERRKAAAALGYNMENWTTQISQTEQQPEETENKSWEQMTKAEQERKMALWVQQQYGMSMGVCA